MPPVSSHCSLPQKTLQWCVWLQGPGEASTPAAQESRKEQFGFGGGGTGFVTWKIPQTQKDVQKLLGTPEMMRALHKGQVYIYFCELSVCLAHSSGPIHLLIVNSALTSPFLTPHPCGLEWTDSRAGHVIQAQTMICDPGGANLV